jgi:hypothetical protein
MFEHLGRWVLLSAVLMGSAAAADHNEAAGVEADDIADIDDVYAWHTGDGKIVVIVTFGGSGASTEALASFDDHVIYGIHIDDTADNVPDYDIWVRFGQDSGGAWGVEFTDIPGSTGVTSGAIQTSLDAGNGLHAEAGVFDDPFFFDFQGLLDTLATGTLSFMNTRDSFAGKNVDAVAFELDASKIASPFKIWASTGRLP